MVSVIIIVVPLIVVLFVISLLIIIVVIIVILTVVVTIIIIIVFSVLKPSSEISGMKVIVWEPFGRWLQRKLFRIAVLESTQA